MGDTGIKDQKINNNFNFEQQTICLKTTVPSLGSLAHLILRIMTVYSLLLQQI